MKLAFRTIWGYREKEVDILLNIGTLLNVSKGLGIEFFEIADKMKVDNYNFTVEMLYQGYISACVERYKNHKSKRYPIYTRSHAQLWTEHLSKEATKEFIDKMTELFGELSKTTVNKKKVTTKQPGRKSESSPVGN